MSENTESGALKIINNQVQLFLHQVRKSFNKDQHYIQSLHYAHIDFSLLNPQSEEYRENVAATRFINVAIRESLVNPILISLINISGRHIARDASEMKRNQFYPVLADNYDYEESRYFQFTISGRIRPIAIKYSESQLNNNKFRRFCRLVSKIYIIEWDEKNLELYRQIDNKPANGFLKKVTYISLKEFFLMFLSENEYELFLKKAKEAIKEARRIIGLETIRVSAPTYMHIFKKSVQRDFDKIDLKNSVYHFIGRNKRIFDQTMKDLIQESSDSVTDIDRIQVKAITNKGYRILLGTEGFAKCFITSEYLFSLFKHGNYSFEYTAVVCGYLKCMEQLLYKIMQKLLKSRLYENASIKAGGGFNYLKTNLKKETQRYREQGMDKKHVPFQESYESAFDITLTPLIALLEEIEEIWNITNHGKACILSWLKNYAANCRNEHFHKDNIMDIEEVKIIRDNTIELILLLMGSLNLPEGLDEMGIYNETFDSLVDILQRNKAPIVYYIQFEEEVIKAHRHFDEPVPEMNEDGNAENVEIMFARIGNTDEIWHDTKEAYDEWFEKTEKIIISKEHIPTRIWYEKRGNTHERILIWPPQKSDTD